MTTISSLRLPRFSAALIALFVAGFATAQTPAKLDPPAKPTVNGKFVGNGKNAAIKFVTIGAREPFSGKDTIEVIFSEKDPAASKRPSLDAMFGKLGSALTLSVFREDGGIFGCEVSHSAHAKRGFSSIGNIKLTDFKIAGGLVSGHVSTGKEVDTFGEKWEVDLTFAAPLPEKLRNPAAPKPVANEPGEPIEAEKPAPKVAVRPLIAARKLPLPKDAADVDYKDLVKQIHLTSPRPVEAVTKEFSASLKQQGWKDATGSLMGKQNAILRREQGDAKLTIMIQPSGAGSGVKIFTEGLDWSNGGDAKPSTSKKAAEAPTADDIEAEANKLLKDALKNLPNGL